LPLRKACNTSSGYMKEVEITQEPIELYKLIKFEGMAASGGEAKSVIAEGLVTVNGVVETQKRKKIVTGDIIELGGEKIQVRLIQGNT
jgi:ribosome-associated protein